MADGNKAIAPEGLNRILKAVGKEHCPPNIDRDALARGLDQCVEWYVEAQKFHTEKFEMAQRRALETVLARVKRLRRVMKDDGIWHDDLWQYLTRKSSPPQTPRAAIEALEVLISQELWQRGIVDSYEDVEIAYRHSFQAFSPFEWLVGDWLPAVYSGLKFHNATVSDGLASGTGTYVRFARAVANELNVKKRGRRYAVASFSKAIKNVALWDVRRRLPRDSCELQEHAEDRRRIIRSLVETPKRGLAEATPGQIQSKI
jgi:hypothetical protein